MLGIQKVYFAQQNQIRNNYYASQRAFGSKNEGSARTVNLQNTLYLYPPEIQKLLDLPQEQRLTAILSHPQEELLKIFQRFAEAIPTRSFVDIKVDPVIFDLPEEVCKKIIEKPIVMKYC